MLIANYPELPVRAYKIGCTIAEFTTSCLDRDKSLEMKQCIC